VDRGLGYRAHFVTRPRPFAEAGRPEDVADVIFLLASTPYVTGQVVTVDGGLSTADLAVGGGTNIRTSAHRKCVATRTPTRFMAGLFLTLSSFARPGFEKVRRHWSTSNR